MGIPLPNKSVDHYGSSVAAPGKPRGTIDVPPFFSALTFRLWVDAYTHTQAKYCMAGPS